MKIRPIYVSLAGGLGNQLFQLASALYFQSREPIALIDCFGAPRKNLEDQPELLSFCLPPSTFFINYSKRDFLSVRLMNLSLKLSLNAHPVSRILLMIIRPFSSLACTIKLGERIALKTGNGVGFDPRLKVRGGQALVGYFQSFIWASNERVLDELMKIEPLHVNGSYKSLISQAQDRRPIILHVRLGDYRQETAIGLLDKNYYLAALAKLKVNAKTDEVWVFSDEPSAAKDIITTDSHFKFRFITETQDSTSLTFQLMRHGSAYIIANSTFSWWAAFLRYDRDAMVIAPNPWFCLGEPPNELIPKDWTLMSRHTSQGASS